jgi:hypothetical protein
MTRHTESTTAPARRTIVAVLAWGLLLSGCAAGSGTEPAASTPTPTPTAEPHEIMMDLAATFPTEEEWLENYTGARLCVAETPGPPTCDGEDWPEPGAYSNGNNLKDGVTDPTAKAVILAVDERSSEDAAQQQLSESHADDVLFTGDFDIPMNEEDRTVGYRGEGTLVDFDRSGWSGYRLTQTSETTGPGGAVQDAATTTTSIVLTDGPLIFTLRVYYASTEPDVAEAEVTGWLDRVFGPEETD